MSILRSLKVVSKLWKYTSYNFDFLFRAFLLGSWTFLKLKTNMHFFKKNDSKIIQLLNKGFLFKTPYGTFVASSVDGWVTMQQNYELHIQKIFDEIYNRFKHDKEKIFLDIGLILVDIQF
ncbi:MAG: hypothetical protein PWP03_695 [Candidatus Woesearchaeota archaeon]|nr:hypothetical protein [Candidatus Woesearchaeota archaeon]